MISCDDLTGRRRASVSILRGCLRCPPLVVSQQPAEPLAADHIIWPKHLIQTGTLVVCPQHPPRLDLDLLAEVRNAQPVVVDVYCSNRGGFVLIRLDSLTTNHGPAHPPKKECFDRRAQNRVTSMYSLPPLVPRAFGPV